MAEHLPYYGHEQGCHNGRIPWGPELCPGCVALRRAFSQGQRDERAAANLRWQAAMDEYGEKCQEIERERIRTGVTNVLMLDECDDYLAACLAVIDGGES